MFSLRIVNVDSYQSSPTKGYDICYSEFRGCEVFKVPIIRIFGITPAGQKGCLHVHGVFPYFSIRCKDVFPNIEAKSLRKCMQELALDIDKALNIASRNSNSHRQHVYKIVITEHIPFYGFHEKAEEFLKIYFYNPFDVSRTAELMTNGVILNKFIQPYEAHIPYILQFFIDYNLFGMNLINVSKFKFRASEDDLVSPLSPLRNQSLSSMFDESSNTLNKVWNIGTLSSSHISCLTRQTVCELEADCCSSEIMNRLNESFSSGKNPGLLAIWEEEKQRRRSENDSSQITPAASQERTDFIETESENFYKKKLRKILESFDVYKGVQKEKNSHMFRDMDTSYSNIADLSSTQDEEMLNMMLSLVNSQSTQLDDDSILGFNHENDLQTENVEDETLEMSQLFTGELEEMWSQMLKSDSEKNKTNLDASDGAISEQSIASNESVGIPQLDGAFDDDDFEPDPKKLKKEEQAVTHTLDEKALIEYCNRLQPVVKLSPTIIIQDDIKSPPKNDSDIEIIEEDSTASCKKTEKQSHPICVPISRNAHCSLIMNIFEDSNDVIIEHTCTSRNSAQYDSLADAEDPSNIVFEIITNLIYKVECLTEGRASGYEEFMEEYKGEKYSSILYERLNKAEKNALYKIKIAPQEKFDPWRRDMNKKRRSTLPIKKRIFINDWNVSRFNQCGPCCHPPSVDFSKIGREIVLVKKLSESDFMKYFKLDSLKVVIPPLSLPSTILNTADKSDNNNPRPMSLIPPHLKKKASKFKDHKWDINKIPLTEMENINKFIDDSKPMNSFQSLISSLSMPKEANDNFLPVIHCQQQDIPSSSSGELRMNEDLKTLSSISKNKSTTEEIDSKNFLPKEIMKTFKNTSESKTPIVCMDTELNCKSEDSEHFSSKTSRKNTLQGSVSKITANDAGSELSVKDENSKTSIDFADFKITPKSIESMRISNKNNSKTSSPVHTKDSRVLVDKKDSKLAKVKKEVNNSKIILCSSDLKVSSSHSNNSKTNSSKKDSKTVANYKNSTKNKASELPICNEKSKGALDKTDSKATVQSTASNRVSKKENSHSSSKVVDSKVTSKCNKSSKLSLHSKHSKASGYKKDLKVVINKIDTKLTSTTDSNIKTKKDSKTLRDNQVSEIIPNKGDSKISFHNKSDTKVMTNNTNSNIKAKQEDSKSLCVKHVSDIVPDNGDSKIPFHNKIDTKLMTNNTNSNIKTKQEDSKSLCAKKGSAIAPNNGDSKIYFHNKIDTKVMINNTNSDTKAKQKDSKSLCVKQGSAIAPNNGDSKISFHNKIDTKVMTNNTNSDTKAKQKDSKSLCVKKGSDIAPNNGDSKISFHNKIDTKVMTSKTNSNIKAKQEDSNTLCDNKVSDIVPNNGDSKIPFNNKIDTKVMTNNTKSNNKAKQKDSKPLCVKQGSDIAPNNGDSKISFHNKIDAKVMTSKTNSNIKAKQEDSNTLCDNKVSDIVPNNGDSKMTFHNKLDNKIETNNTHSNIEAKQENLKTSWDSKVSKIVGNNSDSKISLHKTIDSKIMTNYIDSKIKAKQEDSNALCDTKVSETVLNSGDSKISIHNKNGTKIITSTTYSNIEAKQENYKTVCDNPVSEITPNNGVSEISFCNTDSKKAFNHPIPKTIANYKDSKVSLKIKNSRILLNEKDSRNIHQDAVSKIALKNNDLKIMPTSENAKFEANDDCTRNEIFNAVSDDPELKVDSKSESELNYTKHEDNSENASSQNFEGKETTLQGKEKKEDTLQGKEKKEEYNHSETIQSKTNLTEDNKCAMTSELRQYRRKRMSAKKDSHAKGSLHGGSAPVGSRTCERNSNVQVECEETVSAFKTPETASKCIPVVKLEPCEDLIDKYCKSETDIDCLILGEVSHKPCESQNLPSLKEKRFFRSRARQQNSSSKIIINHKVGVNNSNCRRNRYSSNKKSKQRSSLNFTVQRNDGPNLRKRSASSDSPDKKKLPHILDSNFVNFPDKTNAVDKKLEQVYDFESHLNADDHEFNNSTFFSRTSLKNKSSDTPSKKNLSCKLSLKLNRKTYDKQKKKFISEYGVSVSPESHNNARPRRASSFVNYNEDQIEQQLINQNLTKRLKISTSKSASANESYQSDDVHVEQLSDESSDWSIDDIPISQLRPPETLKCTISKKKLNFVNISHDSEKLPIPKFKVRKKNKTNSLNVSIKLKRSSLDYNNDNSDFKVQEKPSYCIASKKEKISKRNSQTYTSALDVKQKYRKPKGSKLKSSILQFYNSLMEKNASNSSTCIKKDEPKKRSPEKILEFSKPADTPPVSSCISNSTVKNEVSDFSNSSPFTDDCSDDSKRSKSSLKMKLKLKRILTRSNEERIVVVDKELEGAGGDSQDASGEEKSEENPQISESFNHIKTETKPNLCKKTLGAKSFKREQSDFKLKSKFKCPVVKDQIINTSSTPIKDEVDDKKFEGKIPKFKYKPLLANISKDFLEDNVSHTVMTSHSVPPKMPQNVLIVSPKKKSPLKNAESLKKELSQLNEMVECGNSDAISINLKNNHNIKILRKLSVDEAHSIDDSDYLPSNSRERLRERRSSLGCKISSRRHSLLSQDFKKYFDSDNEDNSIEVLPSNEEQEKSPTSCKPCAVKLRRLSTFDVEKYMFKPVINLCDNIINCDPLVASFPSPIVDSKSAESYIDPRKIFENLFAFSSPSRSQSPVDYDTFETLPLLIENDISCGPFSNENSEHSRKEMSRKISCQKALKPSEVFKSIEREDMDVLWNLSYFSPPQTKTSEKTSSLLTARNPNVFTQKENTVELDDLQKLASQANQLCSVSCNLMELEGENSLSLLSEKIMEFNNNNNINPKSKTSFENILGDVCNTFDDQESSSLCIIPTEREGLISNKSDCNDAEKEIAKIIKEESKSDTVFEPSVRIFDFQECLVESDSEMNPLLNDSEIDSVMSSAEMILSNSIDTYGYEHCIQTDVPFDEPSLSTQDISKCASEEPKNHVIDDVFIKTCADANLQKQLDEDLTCNNAIITAADTSSLLIPSLKNNTIPVLAINNPLQEGAINFSAFEEQDLNVNNQYFPVVLAPIPVVEQTDYVENAATTKETAPSSQECVNFLENNELLQSCSVSSTSDIENKNTQVSNALGIPYNGEDDILSMIVKSCDIGEEFEGNVTPVEETSTENITSASICNNLIDNNYIVPGPNFIISSQTEENSFQANSENAVSSSSENNILQKNAEIIVLKTESNEVPGVKHVVCDVQDKIVNLDQTDKGIKSSQEIEEDILLDTMIHSFYGDNSLYGFHGSANNDNISVLCPSLQSSDSFSQSTEKHIVEHKSNSSRSTAETSVYKSDSYLKNPSVSQTKVGKEKDSFHIKNILSTEKVPSQIPSNPLFITHPPQKMSSKRYIFKPSFKPPTRDMVESSIFMSEIEAKPINPTDEDSLSSDSSLNSQTSTNNSPEPTVFNKTVLDKNNRLSSQSVYSSTKPSTYNDKALNNSPAVFQDKTVYNSPFNVHFASTPSTSNLRKEFPLPSVVVSPINKETGLTADTSKRKRKLVFEDSGGPSKILKSGTEKLHNFYNKNGRINALNKSMDSLGNLSFSTIEGPTLDNSRGFKVNSDNFGSDAQVRHEVQHLTVMSLEVHVNTRNDLRPDPKFDAVTAIFYCIYNDIGIRDEEEIVGMIVVDPVSHHQASGQNSSEILRNYLLLCPGVKNGFIYCVESEMALFEKLVTVIKEWDPDILIGYEIQMASWGYLIERAEMLNINLRLLLSRLTDKKETKIHPVEQDPTVADQIADLSRLNIIGRIVLCVWRLMRKEVTLNVYSFENVYYHVLHKRTPLFSFHDLTNWFLGSQKEKVIRYYVIRVQGSIHLLDKLDVIGRTSELARVFGIQFYEVLSRGSQFRVESMMLRTAAPMSYIPVSPSVRQRSHSRAPECVPLILEPESRFYIDPIVVLDFQSLYPSMIIAYNYCFSTCLGRVEHFGKNVPFEFGCTSLGVPVTLLQKLQNDIHISPSGIAFVKSSVRRGILPSMLEEILNTRIMVKQSMKKVKDNNALKRLLDARQLGLKLISNVTYGYTGATFSGRMPNVEVADSVVGKGRETLERAIHMIENTSKWRAKVVYGDTDSLFILLPGRTKKQAFEIGQEIADVVTADNPKPVKLKFEKIYLPCVLQTKKRYVGFMYESIDQENPIFDAKGIETVRRDSCPATAKILEKSLKTLFKTYDVSLVKSYVQKQFSKLLSGRASLIDCIFAKEYRGISGYRPGACVPALEIAKKRLAKDPRSEPRVGERVPYVVVCGFPGLPIIQLVREPAELLRDSNLRINASYYITRVISPPLERVFNLLGADVKSWYTNLARTFKPTLPMTRTANQHRGTLSQYFVTLSCPSCEKPTFTTVCDECREDLQGTTIALNEKIRQWERKVDHLTQICGSCTKSGSSIDCCISFDCPMLFKLNVAKKDLSQAPYLRKVLAHELF